MTKKRVVRWTLAILLVLVVAAGVTLYLLSSRRPGDYHPLTLTEAQRQAGRENFANRVTDFLGKAGEIGSWTTGPIDTSQRKEIRVTQEEASQWIASLPDSVLAQMERYGLSQPAVAIDNHRLTFYIQSAQYDKVIGADLDFVFDDKGMMTIQITSVRLGDLPMPQSFIEDQVHKLVAGLKAQIDQAIASSREGEIGGVKTDEICKGVAELLDAVQGKPILPEIRSRQGQVRIADIKLQKELAIIEIAPLPGGPKPPNVPRLPGIASTQPAVPQP